MPAHAESADVVEEDHAGGATRVARLTQQRADDHIAAARLIHHRAAQPIVLLAQLRQLLGDCAAERRPAADDQSRRLAAGVAVDDVNLLHAY